MSAMSQHTRTRAEQDDCRDNGKEMEQKKLSLPILYIPNVQYELWVKTLGLEA